MGIEVRAIAKYVRMSPRKVKLVVDLVRGRHANEALTMLRFSTKAAARCLTVCVSLSTTKATVFPSRSVSAARGRMFMAVSCGILKAMEAVMPMRISGTGFPIVTRTL